VFQISAQESRRKKKEYMDSLERKYEVLQAEAASWRRRAETLEAEQGRLIAQLATLQARVMAAENKNNITTFILPVEQKTSGQLTSEGQ
jgi:hypothetical protein